MHTRLSSLSLPVLALVLAFDSGGIAQKRPATAQKKVFPPVPVHQRQFCAAYREDAARHHEYETKAAAAPNPIARLNVEKTEPEFEKLFYAKQAEVMADGSFQNWTGFVQITVNRHYSQSDGRQDQGQVVLLKVEFPCIWTDYTYGTGKEQNYSYGRHRPEESLQFGNGLDGWPRYGDPHDFGIGYIPLESAFGQSLSALSQDEPVAVSGNFICSTDKGCLTNGGYGRNQLLMANITAVRSLKTGKVFKPSVPDPMTLSQDVPFEPLNDNYYLFFNREAQEILERYAKVFDDPRRSSTGSTLREGTRFIPLMKSAREPVLIKGPERASGSGRAPGTYMLIAILDAAGKPKDYAMIPNVKELPPKIERPPLDPNPTEPKTVAIPESWEVVSFDETVWKKPELERLMKETEDAGFWKDPSTGIVWTSKQSESLDWSDARSYCQRLSLGGHSGWRLPTALELTGMYDPSVTYAYSRGKNVPQRYHVKGGIRLWRGSWSSVAYGETEAWVQFFWEPFWDRSARSYGRRLFLKSKPTSLGTFASPVLAALCVYRPGEDSVQQEADRRREEVSLEQREDARRGEITRLQAATATTGYWRDSSTGLTWAADKGVDMQWSEARDYCQNLVLDGRSGWRLPTIDELQGIYLPPRAVDGRLVEGTLKGGFTSNTLDFQSRVGNGESGPAPWRGGVWSSTQMRPAPGTLPAARILFCDSPACRVSAAALDDHRNRALCVNSQR